MSEQIADAEKLEAASPKSETPPPKIPLGWRQRVLRLFRLHRGDNSHTQLSRIPSDDRYRVTIFDPSGDRVASTGMHLERQGALIEASRYVGQIFIC